MVQIYILAVATFLGLAGQVTPECCRRKIYKGDTYDLLEEMGDTIFFKCKDQCVYKKVGVYGSKFCFKSGGHTMPTCDVVGVSIGGADFVAANEKFVDEILGGPDEACLLCLFLHAAVCIPICIHDGPEECLVCIVEHALQCLKPCGFEKIPDGEEAKKIANFIQFGPFGFLPTGTQNFNDSKSGVLTGSITSITIYLGSFGNILEFVAGIDVTYGNDIPTLHGQRTDNNKTCDPLNAGQNYGGVLGRAGSPPLSSPVFLLDFLDTAGNSLDCRFGNNEAGDAFEVPSNISETIVFFAGATTTDTNQLSTLFVYQQAIA